MRISPLTNQFSKNNKFNSKKVQTKFERNDISSNSTKSIPRHKYTGNVSADLAYASMRDSKIADALRLMELI